MTIQLQWNIFEETLNQGHKRQNHHYEDKGVNKYYGSTHLHLTEENLFITAKLVKSCWTQNAH